MSTIASASKLANSDSVHVPAAGPSGAGSASAGGAPPALDQQHQQLVRDCLAGAPGAWDEFVARFAGLFGYIVDQTTSQRRWPLAAGDREDLVAEILIELLRNDAAALRSFAGRASLPTYLTVIARRVAVRSLQRDRERHPLPVEAVKTADHHDAIASIIQRDTIESLLTALDETEARLVRLHHLEARSYGEISQLTGLPLGSIGPALSKARQKIRARAADGQGAGADAVGAMTTLGSARSTGS